MQHVAEEAAVSRWRVQTCTVAPGEATDVLDAVLPQSLGWRGLTATAVRFPGNRGTLGPMRQRYTSWMRAAPASRGDQRSGDPGGESPVTVSPQLAGFIPTGPDRGPVSASADAHRRLRSGPPGWCCVTPGSGRRRGTPDRLGYAGARYRHPLCVTPPRQGRDHGHVWPRYGRGRRPAIRRGSLRDGFRADAVSGREAYTRWHTRLSSCFRCAATSCAQLTPHRSPASSASWRTRPSTTTAAPTAVFAAAAEG
jgi:hypothetical protein